MPVGSGEVDGVVIDDEVLAVATAGRLPEC